MTILGMKIKVLELKIRQVSSRFNLGKRGDKEG